MRLGPTFSTGSGGSQVTRCENFAGSLAGVVHELGGSRTSIPIISRPIIHCSRQAIIEDARSKRSERQQARKREEAARRIQRVWRGGTARQRLRAQLLKEWLSRHTKQFSKPDVGWKDMLSTVLPPALWALLGPRGCQQAMASVPTLREDPLAFKVARGVLVLSLHVLRTDAPETRELLLERCAGGV